MGRTYSIEEGGFEKFKRKPKKVKKGKGTRSNQKQFIRDTFVNNNIDDVNDEDYYKVKDWERDDERS
jgi:hypothetical protein